jgi:hypothetical protein
MSPCVSRRLALAAASVMLGLTAAGCGGGATCPTQTAAFGWEANILHNDGANLILPATATMHLTGITVDYATAKAPGTRGGWHETLAYVTIDPTSMGAAPAYQPQESGAAGWGASTRTGSVSHGGGMTRDLFAQAILKHTDSSQLVTESLDDTLQAGDRLVVHMNAQGTPVDAEAQGTVDYNECSS